MVEQYLYRAAAVVTLKGPNSRRCLKGLVASFAQRGVFFAEPQQLPVPIPDTARIAS